MYFYLTTNTNLNEPEVLLPLNFIIITACSDGSATVVLTLDPVDDPALQFLTIDDAKSILDSWIMTGNSSSISLDDYIYLDEIKPVLVEQANIYRIKRGYFTDNERAKFSSQSEFIKNYPFTTQRMGSASTSTEYNNILALIGK